MDNKNEVLIYEDKDGITKVNVTFTDEDIWLTQNQLAEIYKTTQQNISQHIASIYKDNELPIDSTNKKLLLVQNEGGNNERVNSELGQLHEKVESTQEKYEEAYRNFESMLKTYSDATSDHRYLEDVPRVVDNLQREIDITVDQAKIFRKANDEFMQATSKSADQLTRDRFEENQKFYKSNEETIQKALKLLSEVENDAQIKKKQALILLGYV